MKFFIVLLFGFICGTWAIDSHTNPNQPIIWGVSHSYAHHMPGHQHELLVIANSRLDQKCVVATNFCKFKIYTKNGINKKKNMQRWDYSRTSRACGDSKVSDSIRDEKHASIQT